MNRSFPPRLCAFVVLVSLVFVSCDAPVGVGEFVEAEGSTASEAALLAGKTGGSAFPSAISLPDGFSPEGIAIGGRTFFVGSIPTGKIYKGDLMTGAGEILVDGGSSAIGLHFDVSTGWLWVANGEAGSGTVYDGDTGELIETYDFGGAFINDVIVTRNGAYFTDSFVPQLHVVPFGSEGGVPDPSDASSLSLGVEFEFLPGTFNANGIVGSNNGEALLVVNGTTGRLYRVDPGTGFAQKVDTDPLPSADGLVLRGRTLWVVQNFLNQITVLTMSADLLSAEPARVISNGDLTGVQFEIPTTAAPFGNSLYVVNAKFDEAPPGLPNSLPFEIIRVPQ